MLLFETLITYIADNLVFLRYLKLFKQMKFCLRNFIIGKFRNLSIYDLIYKIVWNGRRDSRELRNSPQSGLA